MLIGYVTLHIFVISINNMSPTVSSRAFSSKAKFYLITFLGLNIKVDQVFSISNCWLTHPHLPLHQHHASTNTIPVLFSVWNIEWWVSIVTYIVSSNSVTWDHKSSMQTADMESGNASLSRNTPADSCWHTDRFTDRQMMEKLSPALHRWHINCIGPKKGLQSHRSCHIEYHVIVQRLKFAYQILTGKYMCL